MTTSAPKSDTNPPSTCVQRSFSPNTAAVANNTITGFSASSSEARLAGMIFIALKKKKL